MNNQMSWGSDFWQTTLNISTFSLIIVWTQLTVLRTMIVYVPKVSHNTFEISGYLLYYTISYTAYHIITNCISSYCGP